MFKDILWIILTHYISDYSLQNDFLVQTRGKYWHSLLVHSIIYGLMMSLCFDLLGVFVIWKAFVLVGSHYIIDYQKANAKDKSKALTTYLYIDQILHMLINIILYFM